MAGAPMNERLNPLVNSSKLRLAAPPARKVFIVCRRTGEGADPLESINRGCVMLCPMWFFRLGELVLQFRLFKLKFGLFLIFHGTDKVGMLFYQIVQSALKFDLFLCGS